MITRKIAFCFYFILLFLLEMSAQNPVEFSKERIGFSHWRVRTEIIIDAKPKVVWEVLTNFDAMPEWSTTLQGIDGVFSDNEEVLVRYKLKPNKSEIAIYNQVIRVEEGRQFGWSGNVFSLGMRDNHQFILQELPDGRTKFIQEDDAKGGLTWLVAPIVTNVFVKLYSTFNMDLKKQVESLSLSK
ncbi:SRPBCC domain-containing protein [Saprospiraceae bacterium]|nr:SRPBCC domain-containing protein [Saprospiraceae bacterium]